MGGREKKENSTSGKKHSGFSVLPQLGDILPDFHLWGEVSRSPHSLRRRIFMSPVHTLGSFSVCSALTSVLILFH